MIVGATYKEVIHPGSAVDLSGYARFTVQFYFSESRNSRSPCGYAYFLDSDANDIFLAESFEQTA